MNYNDIVSLSKWIEQYIKDRNTNITALAKKLELKSRNSLQRVCDGSAGKSSLLSIIDALKKHQIELDLKDEDLIKLSSIEQHISIGEEYYKYYSAFESLFYNNYDDETKIEILGISKPLSYESIVVDNDQINEILILNSCFSATMYLIRDILRHGSSASNQTPPIYHYIIKGTEQISLINKLSTMLPVLFSSGYKLLISNNTFATSINETSNFIIIKYQSGQELLVQFINQECCMLIKTRDVFESYKALLSTSLEQFVRVGTEQKPLQASDIFSDFQKFAEDEVGNNLLEIRPDFCIRFIPCKIMKAAFIRAYLKKYGHHPDPTVVDDLSYLHEIRFKCAFSEETNNCLIVSQAQIREFCDTGNIVERNLNLDAFTIYERIEIMSHVLYQMEHNSHFNLFLICDDGLLLDRTIKLNYIAYGANRLRIVPIIPEMESLYLVGTLLDIEDKDIVSAFIDFYNYELIPNKTLPKDMTIKFFKEMIIMLASQLYNSLPLDSDGNL